MPLFVCDLTPSKRQHRQNSGLLKQRLHEATTTMQRLASCETDLQKYQSLDLDPEHIKRVEEELHCKY
jgi:hypothetical protein